MFVIADMEWITNSVGHQSPAQLAALRVDEEWKVVDEFSAFIRPRDREFCDWEHIAYTGGSISDFMYAESAHNVLDKFQNWLNVDDVLLWWYSESENLFKKLVAIILKIADVHQSVSVAPYVYAHLAGQSCSRGNLYKIAEARGVLTRPNLKHYSKNDVRVICELMVKISYPQAALLQPVVKPPKKEKKPVIYPYCYDPQTNLFHVADCPTIDGVETQGYETMKSAFRKGFEPCKCCKKEYKTAFRERNIDIIARTEYTYIYSPNSSVFHKYTCGLMHSAKDIMGTCKYENIIKTERRPCKVCNPTPYDAAKIVPKKQKKVELKKKPNYKLNKNQNKVSQMLAMKRGDAEMIQKPALPKETLMAISRQKTAAEERVKRLKEKNLTVTERNDLFTLTQPRFAFWAGRGYDSFHLRSCSKLQGVTNLRGFGTYKEAVQAGYTPCRKCKPTSKHDMKLSIPITNRVREDEKIEDLEALCDDAGFIYKKEDGYFCLDTPAGKWRVNIVSFPLEVEHINLATLPVADEYHKQPRLFLSFVDLFSYIKRHDEKLMRGGDRKMQTEFKELDKVRM